MNQFDPRAASDAELVERFATGRDQRAFTEVVRRHGPMVLGTARRVLRHEQDAEDAFQATFLALAASADRLRCRRALAAWLHQTAVRSARSLGRSNGKWQRKVDRGAEIVSEWYLVEPQDDLAEVLDEELRRLAPAYWAVLVLCDLEGLSRAEAAHRLGASVGALKTRLARGRKLLQARLVRRGVTLSGAAFAAATARCARATTVLAAVSAQEVTTKAALFAAGSSAAEIGVSTTVIHTAQGVLRAMTITKLTIVGALALAITFSVGGIGGVANIMTTAAQAETIFFDDFSNPNPTNPGREPARWIPTSSNVSIVDGSFHVSSSSPTVVAATRPDGVDLHDVSVRMQVRSTQGAPSVQLRYTPGVPDTGYYAFLSLNGRTGISISGNNPRDILTGQTDFRPAEEDVLMQFEAIGSHLSLYLWRPGEPFPSVPILTATDDTISRTGGVQIGLTSLPASQVSGSFRFIHVADTPIPEPSTATLSAIFFGGIFMWQWRRSR